jgi:hypothetical protein
MPPINETTAPGFRIETTDAARGWILELVDSVREARFAIDLAIDTATQRKLERIWLVKHGSALGTLTCLHRCDMITATMYDELRTTIMATMIPTVVTL